MWFCILIIGVIFAGIIGIFFLQPTSWDVEQEQNIVIVPSKIDVSQGKILFLSYRAKDGSTQLKSIPAQDLVTVAGGYGQYPVQSVFPLLILEKHSPQFIRAVLSFALHVPVDSVWETTNANVFTAQSPAEIGKLVLERKIVPRSFSVKDAVIFYRALQTQQNRRQDVSTLNDWFNQIPAYSQDFKSCRVGIINTTTVAGTGARVNTIVEKSGGNVLRLDDEPLPVPKSQILFHQETLGCSAFIEHLKVLFPETIEVKNDNQIFYRERTELEIRLGEDMAQFLSKEK